MMGEIGGNDYNYAFFLGGTILDLKRTVPLVVGKIASAVSVSMFKTIYFAGTTQNTKYYLKLLFCRW